LPYAIPLALVENVLFKVRFHVLPSVLHIMLPAAPPPLPTATRNVSAVWYGAGYPFA
jgi:hypothetical protein